MQKASLAEAESEPHGLISKKTVTLQGVSVTQVTFGVGAKWSNDLKSYAGTSTCGKCVRLEESLPDFVDRACRIAARGFGAQWYAEGGHGRRGRGGV